MKLFAPTLSFDSKEDCFVLTINNQRKPLVRGCETEQVEAYLGFAPGDMGTLDLEMLAECPYSVRVIV